MPSSSHELLVELFRRAPLRTRDLLVNQLGLDLPPWGAVQLRSAQLSELSPAEVHADLVLEPDVGPLIILEIQLRIDARKRYTWPLYAAGLRARHQRDVVVLVVTPSRRVARWAAEPIPMGPGCSFQVAVLGPERIPLITDPELARERAELTLLSVLAHGRGPSALQVAAAGVVAASNLDDEGLGLYYHLIATHLSPAVRRILENDMSRPLQLHPLAEKLTRMTLEARQARRAALQEGREEGREEGWQEGRQEGRQEGLQSALLGVIAARGLTLSEAAADLVRGTHDRDLLERWIRRAAVATDPDEVFQD